VLAVGSLNVVLTSGVKIGDYAVVDLVDLSILHKNNKEPAQMACKTKITTPCEIYQFSQSLYATLFGTALHLPSNIE